VRPIPTAWLPWPGKTKAISCIVLRVGGLR
jgi:hypothetical protein